MLSAVIPEQRKPYHIQLYLTILTITWYYYYTNTTSANHYPDTYTNIMYFKDTYLNGY